MAEHAGRDPPLESVDPALSTSSRADGYVLAQAIYRIDVCGGVMAITELTGAADPVRVGEDVTISAPGLLGGVEAAPGPPELLTEAAQALSHALSNSGMQPTTHILMTHAGEATGEVTVTVPAPAAGNHALLLVHDASGAVTWHRPDQPTRAQARLTGAPTPPPAATMSFTIPAIRFAANDVHTSLLHRLAGFLHHFTFHPTLDGARKLLSVVEYPVEHLVGWAGSKWFAAWENNKHPAVVRWFPPTGGLAVGEPLSPTNWSDLTAGPMLLFIHGIFSSCAGAFGGIGNDDHTWAALRKKYNGLIIGYDHPTASVSPDENAQWLLDQLPDVRLDVDVVCHSRGGLVARSLAAKAAASMSPTRGLNVRTIIFAATPNGGSEITDPGKWEKLINRLSSLVTLPAKVLPVPIDEVTEILAGLLELVKIVGVGIAVDLPGLEDMRPNSTFLSGLATVAEPTATYYAAAADFEPGPLLANLFNGLDDAGQVVDSAIFPGVRNDIAVPYNGVWDPANPDGATPAPGGVVAGFPVPEGNRLPIGPGSVYWHSTYFPDQAMRDALVRWLAPEFIA